MKRNLKQTAKAEKIQSISEFKKYWKSKNKFKSSNFWLNFFIKNLSLSFKILICSLHLEANFAHTYWFPPHLHRKDYSLCVSLFEVYQVIRIKHPFHCQWKNMLPDSNTAWIQMEYPLNTDQFLNLAKKISIPSNFNAYQSEKSNKTSLFFTSHIRTKQNGFLITKP